MRTIDPFPYPLLIGLLILGLVGYRRRKRGWLYLMGLSVFGLYVMAVIFVVFFPIQLPETWPSNLRGRDPSYILATIRNVNLIPFNYGRMFAEARRGMITPRIVFQEIGGNILLTIPFGAGMGFLTRPHGWGVARLAFGTGLALEGTQLLSRLIGVETYHAVDINDVLLNALGVALGYGLYRVGQWGVQKLRLAFDSG